MNNFSLLRLKNVLVWDVFSNWKSYLRLFVGIVLGFFIIQLLTMYEYMHADFTLQIQENPNIMEIWQGRVMEVAFSLSMVAFVGYYYLGASMILSTMKDKQNRSNFLLIPATNLEKFAERWLMCVPIIILMCLVGILGADLLRIIITPLIGYNSLPLLFTYICKAFSQTEIFSDAYNFFSFSLALCIIFVNHALFLLGGCIFRRHPFISTCAAMLVCLILLAIADNFIAMLDLHFSLDHDLSYSTLSIIVWGVNISVTSLLYWLSYRIFTRTQVIQNKWINF
ncbi:MAG: hypothetical protein IJT13_04375 [Bacteroidaceae bacterium]|nr:hypothetical protein [Bacteroidaceae bacterium]